MAQTVTFSSSLNNNAIIALNPVAKATTVLFSNSVVGSTGAVTVELTLDDLGAPGFTSTMATWATLSSGAAMLTSNVTSLVYTVLSPIGGVRINSTANDVTTPNVMTLKALQSVTA